MTHKNKYAALLAVLVVAVAAVAFAPSARANVYASNIKVNGSLLSNVSGLLGSSYNISYILNEPATRGVQVQIHSGTNLVRAINLAAGAAGTLKGLNLVSWDGKDNNGDAVGVGIYTISITASASGFSQWTQTSTDTNAGYYVFSPRGMAVNTNPRSPYYGRVFVGNAKNNSGGSAPGDVDGILKLNADGSLADEGQSSAGYAWVDDSLDDSPHYLRYGQDDRIYALDWTGWGTIVACDMAMTASQVVLNENNYTDNPDGPIIFGGIGWGMMDVTDAGTPNGLLWLGDHDSSGAGIWVWHMTNGVADPNDTVGTQAVAVGGDLSYMPSGGFMMDESSNIFVSQLLGNTGDPTERTMVFTNWDRMTALSTGTKWQVGSNDDTMLYIYDTVLNSRTNPTYVALPMGNGVGGIRVLNTGDGSVVTNAAGTQSLTNLDAPNYYYGAAWDAVGNLYGASSTLSLWRVFSPPGTNQATTVAFPSIQMISVPKFTSIVVNNSRVTLTFIGSSGDSPSNYVVLGAAAATGQYMPVSGAVVSQISPGVFQATATTNSGAMFYRIKR